MVKRKRKTATAELPRRYAMMVHGRNGERYGCDVLVFTMTEEFVEYCKSLRSAFEAASEKMNGNLSGYLKAYGEIWDGVFQDNYISDTEAQGEWFAELEMAEGPHLVTDDVSGWFGETDGYKAENISAPMCSVDENGISFYFEPRNTDHQCWTQVVPWSFFEGHG